MSQRDKTKVSLKALKERESPILYVARGQAQVCVSLIGTMDMGSWFHSSSLPIYGGDHVIDNKSTHNCHAFMVNFYDGYMF